MSETDTTRTEQRNSEPVKWGKRILAILMGILLWSKKRWKVLLATVSTVALVTTLLVGSSLLMRPRVSVACGAIDLRIPAPLAWQYFLMQFAMFVPAAKDSLTGELTKSLRNYGMPTDKVENIVSAIKADQTTSLSNIPLEPHEKNILSFAMFEALSNISNPIRERMVMPNGVLFFEIANSGRSAARNVHAVIRLAGRVTDSEIDSENRVTSSSAEAGRFTCDIDFLSPGSKTRAIIWFTGGRGEANEITVTFDQGTVRRKFAVDKFYLSKE